MKILVLAVGPVTSCPVSLKFDDVENKTYHGPAMARGEAGLGQNSTLGESQRPNLEVRPQFRPAKPGPGEIIRGGKQFQAAAMRMYVNGIAFPREQLLMKPDLASVKIRC